MKLVKAKKGYRKVGDKYLLAKKCTKCGRWLVANTDNFHKNKRGKYGLRAECKECSNNQNKQYREANREKRAEYQKQWRQDNKEKRAEYGKQYRENNKEKLAEYGKQYYQDNKEKEAERRKQWRETNPEYAKQYYENNKEKVDERHKQWYQDNKEKMTEYHKQYNKQYYQSPQGQVARFNGQQRRRIKEEQQGTGITKDQWLEMMSFFDWKCAYSGETLTKDTRSVDHIVPLNSGGDNMIWNCVPMKLNYNRSKHAKDMLEWYREQDFYSEARLAKIYEWQEHARKKWEK